ncbi:MAG TPA: GyrI-like domain-containing protein [Roseiflexaceae bacterium]|nr:GyrI-like domain-containing protein [Roseiflexaceae bacterium]
MTKIDFTQQLKQLYRPSAADFAVVEVPPMTYLMVDGHGDPNTSPAYAQAVEALYATSYRTKFISKAELGRDYVVPPLEGLWWAEDMARFTSARDKSAWDWTLMIMQPDWISVELHQRALEELGRQRDLPGLKLVRRDSYHEGRAVQILHIGSYDDEGPVLARLHEEWLPQHGYVENGKHHEIYLSDARRVPASRLKTVLRQPIRTV